MIRQELMGNRRMTLFHDYHRIGLDGPQGTPGGLIKITFFAKPQAIKPSFTREEVVISRGKLQCRDIYDSPRKKYGFKS
jgi:hypothetical protein